MEGISLEARFDFMWKLGRCARGASARPSTGPPGNMGLLTSTSLKTGSGLVGKLWLPPKSFVPAIASGTLTICRGFITTSTTSTRKILSFIHLFMIFWKQVLKAIKLDGISVKGYYAWSLLDNFEWAEMWVYKNVKLLIRWAMGYTEKFGLHQVNMSDSARTRTPKESSRFLSRLVAENGFSESDGPC